MKLWVLTTPPPASEDTAYLIGRATSRCTKVLVSQVAGGAETPPPPPAERFDAILNRSFNPLPGFLTALDRLAADCGVPVINPGQATLRACDKRSYIDDFPGMIPQSRVVRSLEEISKLQHDLGGEVVLKDPYGKHGTDVIRFAGEKDADEALALLAKMPQDGVVAQAFCPGFIAGDKRVIAQRDGDGGFEISAWFKRVPEAGGWKSNVSAGGSILPCELDEDERELAVEVATIAQLDYVGIDIARENGRCLLIETNAYTGGHINFDTERRAHSGDDFARMILRLAEEGRR